MKPLIVDATASGHGRRTATLDAIGAGARSVAGVLEARGLVPRVATSEDILSGRVELGEYDALLLSGMTCDIPALRRVASRWRAASAGPIIIGGPAASDPETALIKCHADLAVIGEGEQTLQELLARGLDRGCLPEEPDRILGLAYLDGGAPRMSGLRPVMRRADYDRFTPSTRIIRGYPLYYAARVYVEILRGCSNYWRAQAVLPEGSCAGCGRCRSGGLEGRYDCPHGVPPGCGYCSVPSLFGPTKSRSAGKIAEEVRGLLAEGVCRLVLSAPDLLDYGRDLHVEPEPLTDPRRPEPNYEALEELLARLTGLDAIADGEASLMAENVKGSLVTERAARLLGRYLEGSPVNLGFETGSARHGLALGRSSTPEENRAAVGRLRRAGLVPYVYFVHGLPGQTVETAGETVRAIGESVREGAARIILYRFQPLPMSAFAGQPAAPPAARDRLGGWIQRAALEANRAIKGRLVGRRLRVVVAGPYGRDRRLQVAYPMRHGPVVLVEGAAAPGEVVDVVVASVASDRMVRGRLTSTIL